MILSLVRIDDRLIHGQVATVWTKETNVSRIIVVSDEVAQDELRKTLLKQAAPPGVSASIVDIAKAGRVYKNPKYENDRCMLLFTTPLDVERAIEEGVDIKEVNVGGISYKDGKTKITKAIFLSKEEADSFRRLKEKGIKLDVRIVASDNSEDMIKLLDEHDM